MQHYSHDLVPLIFKLLLNSFHIFKISIYLQGSENSQWRCLPVSKTVYFARGNFLNVHLSPKICIFNIRSASFWASPWDSRWSLLVGSSVSSATVVAFVGAVGCFILKRIRLILALWYCLVLLHISKIIMTILCVRNVVSLLNKKAQRKRFFGEEREDSVAGIALCY